MRSLHYHRTLSRLNQYLTLLIVRAYFIRRPVILPVKDKPMPIVNPCTSTPRFRVMHPISSQEYLVTLQMPRARASSVIVDFAKDSPNAPGVRRVIHSKRRGYGEFLDAARALLHMTTWHHPAPYLRTIRGQPKVRNPDHYAEWNTEHHTYAQRQQHQTTVSLFIDQIADPVRGRGRRLDTMLIASRTAHDERKMGGAVTAVSRARMNLRGEMLKDLARALAIVGPHHVHFNVQRLRKRGPTALGYTHEEVAALGRMWTAVYEGLEKLQHAVKNNELYATPPVNPGTPVVRLSTRPLNLMPDVDGTGLQPPKFSFELDPEPTKPPPPDLSEFDLPYEPPTPKGFSFNPDEDTP